MGATQAKATTRNPNELDMARVATYERTIRASLERVWENVLDWEHLPHLHSDSFGPIELIAAGEWGWRVYSTPDRTGTIELVIASDDSYVSRSYAGTRQTAEIWTSVKAHGNETAITVDFDIPGVPVDKVRAIGERMLALYETLWDEDEAMMRERQIRLTESRSRERSVEIDPEPGQRFQLAGREYEVISKDGGFMAAPTVCPHLLGPLAVSEAEGGVVICPWHGYRFDLASGRCIEPAGAQCRLPPIPALEEQDGKLIASL